MDLFDYRTDIQHNQEVVASISGLALYEEFISPEEEQVLITWIDRQAWRQDLKRRVQHYGYLYDYKAKRVSATSYLGPLPRELQTLCAAIKETGIISFSPNQAIINEYLPGQGIAAHVDCEPCFGDTILSLSLLSKCTMTFTEVTNHQRSADVLLNPRGLLVLEKKARYEFTHGIAARKKDVFNRTVLKRSRRVSITFRKVLIE